MTHHEHAGHAYTLHQLLVKRARDYDMTDLSAFVDEGIAGQGDGAGAAQSLPVVMFTFDDAGYVLAADRAVAIIPMRPITRLPGAHAGFAGALQDRGRIIALLSHPLAVGGAHAAGTRVIVCQVERGLLGIPVASLAGLQELHIRVVPEHAELITHDGQPYTFIDPRVLSEICGGAAGGA